MFTKFEVSRLARAIFAASCLAGFSATAYELSTHARITYSALLQSRAYSDPHLIANLGLSSGWATRLGRNYADNQPVATAIRSARDFDFDRDKMPRRDVLDRPTTSYRTLPQGWLMAGAVSEHDS